METAWHVPLTLFPAQMFQNDVLATGLQAQPWQKKIWTPNTKLCRGELVFCQVFIVCNQLLQFFNDNQQIQLTPLQKSTHQFTQEYLDSTSQFSSSFLGSIPFLGSCGSTMSCPSLCSGSQWPCMFIGRKMEPFICLKIKIIEKNKQNKIPFDQNPKSTRYAELCIEVRKIQSIQEPLTLNSRKPRVKSQIALLISRWRNQPGVRPCYRGKYVIVSRKT